MKLISLTPQTVDVEHICCALSSKSTQEGVREKKLWLTSRFAEGLKFKKIDARGKVFIEYLPAQNAWVPVSAEGYMMINCFWVAGSYKGKGYGKQLLTECEEDALAQGMKGVTVIVGDKKRPYLSDKEFLLRNGYEICDTCAPYFELLVKRFDASAPAPSFKDCARQALGEGIKGMDIYYTAQCPFTVPYITLLTPVIMATDYPIRITQIKTKAEAQNHPSPVTTYSVFIDGQFYSHEIFTAEKLRKLIVKLQS